jgi:hypothetical protein
MLLNDSICFIKLLWKGLCCWMIQYVLLNCYEKDYAAEWFKIYISIMQKIWFKMFSTCYENDYAA